MKNFNLALLYVTTLVGISTANTAIVPAASNQGDINSLEQGLEQLKRKSYTDIHNRAQDAFRQNDLLRQQTSQLDMPFKRMSNSEVFTSIGQRLFGATIMASIASGWTSRYLVSPIPTFIGIFVGSFTVVFGCIVTQSRGRRRNRVKQRRRKFVS